MSWSRKDVSQALRDLHVPEDANLFLHVNAGFLGHPKEGSLAGELVKGMTSHSARTLMLPAFSYSFGQGEVYDPLLAPKNMGVLSDFACSEGWLRSLDPMFSIWVSGPLSEQFAQLQVPASFGQGSIFRRVLDRDDTFLITVNLGAGSTLVHDIEHELSVPYRFEKEFRGYVKTGEAETVVNWVSYVRDLRNPATTHDFRRLTWDLDSMSLRKTARLGRGQISSIRLRDLRNHVKEAVASDARYLIFSGVSQ